MNITLTTNHPSSSYGKPVAIIDGQAYGPADTYHGIPVASYVIVNIAGNRPDLDMMMSFLAADSGALKRGIATLARWHKAATNTI